MASYDDRGPQRKVDTTIPVRDYERLRTIAQQDRTSVAAQVRTAIARHIDRRLPPNGSTAQDDQ